MLQTKRLVPYVLCTQCGVHMKLSALAPEVDGKDIMQFNCDCGFHFELKVSAGEIRGLSDTLGSQTTACCPKAPSLQK